MPYFQDSLRGTTFLRFLWTNVKISNKINNLPIGTMLFYSLVNKFDQDFQVLFGFFLKIHFNKNS